MALSKLEKVEKFHRLKNRIANIVLRTIGDKEIIHGEQAVAVRLPQHLQRQTRDIDVFSETPKVDAIEAEQELDEAFGGNFFEVTQAEHPGTHKVRSRINGRTYADFSEKEGKIPSERIQGNNYVTMQFIKKRLRAILRDKEKEFRHQKDRDTLNRIAIHEKRMEQQSIGSSFKQHKKEQLINIISIKKQQKVNLFKNNGIKFI
ncbi:hypothetical protein LCGC14_1029030 [marine sediment metagenome]|uniref:Uncharacterized protein n=1 Tax=marine sediment metagenome TaxID=412755 RepID=A0A0F9MZQ3_9ZZZZ